MRVMEILAWETSVPFVWVVLFLTGLLLILGLWQRKINRLKTREIVAQIRQSQDQGTDHPIAQHPRINQSRCIGCASCVAACPEEGVLGLVDGVAHVIHGSRCIGHARCADACPVAALTLGLSDISARADIPLLSDDLETSVPGLYIAGDLGGFTLITNAVEQGTRVVDTIATRKRDSGRQSHSPDIIDVLIVGAGPTGIAATLKAVEQKLTYATIDQEELGGTVRQYPRRKLTMTQPVDLPLYGRMKKREYVKEDLIELWAGIIREFNIVIQSHTRLHGVERQADCLVAELSTGTIVAHSIVLALGRRGTPRKLGVPGEKSEKVLYQLIDTATYTDQKILIVGGGDSAVEAATGLANQPGNEVTLSYRRPHFFRIKPRNEARIETYQKEGKVRTFFSSNVKSIQRNSVILTGGEGDAEWTEELENDYVFIFAGGEPPYPFLKNMGIRFGGEQEESRPESSRIVKVTR